MAQRRRTRPAAAVERFTPDLATRIATSYLAALLGAVIGGLLVVIAVTVLPSVCVSRGDAAGACVFGGTVASGLLGWSLGVLVMALVLRLGWWFWCAFVALLLGLMIPSSVDAWWWWLAIVLIPAVAAVASAEYRSTGRPRAQRVALIAAAVVAAVAFGLWVVLVQ